MKKLFKQHLVETKRIRTSTGRDLDDGLFLDRNERVIRFPEKVLSEIYGSLPKTILNTYPEPQPLYKKLSEYLGIDEDKIFLTSGSTEGIKVLYETLAKPGDHIVSIDPTYPMYEVYSKIFQTHFKKVAFKSNFSVDVERLIDEIDDRTAFVCLPNPNLPIESVVGRNEVLEIIAKCEKHGSVLVVDEAYNLFGVTSSIDLIDQHENLVILRSFSKAFGLAGIRLGYMVSNSENIDYLSRTRSLVEASGPTMEIAKYMLDHMEIAKENVSKVKEGGQYLQSKLTEANVKWFGGTYSNGLLIFLKDSTAVEHLVSEMKKDKIYIRGAFQPPYDNCARITVGPIDVMKRFFDVFHKWHANYA